MNDALYRPRPADTRAPLVLGCMNFGRRTPEPEAQAIIDAALDHGVTFFDTANAYGDGESERILGRALAGRRERVQIATKVGSWRREGLAPARVRASIDESLMRLGMDHVDLYYLHVPDHETPIEATLEGMRDVLASGKARHFGVSNHASWQLLEILMTCDRLGMPRPVVSQQLYNLLIRQLDLEYFRFTQRYPLHTTIYNPLAGGLLARPLESVSATAIPRGSRFDKNGMYQRRYLSDVFLDATRALDDVAREAGMTRVDLAYAWLAGRPGVDSILIGPGSLQHLEDAVRAHAITLPSDVLTKVDAVHRALVGTDASYAR